MKKIIVAVLALALVALVVTLVVLSLDSTGDERVGLSILSVKVEAERLSKIGVTFPSPGNAAGTYVPYLKGEAQITKEEWFQKIGFSTLDDSNDGDRELLEKGVRLAGKDIEAVLKAGRMAESKVWGEYYKPDPSVNIFAQEIPQYINLVRLGVLTIAKGNQLGSAGDPDGAIEHYLTVLRMGHHMEKGSLIISYQIGIAVKIQAAKALAEHYRSRGMNDAAQKWDLYREIMDMRKKAYRNFQIFIRIWSEKATRKFIMDPDMPYSFRLEALGQKKFCVDKMDSGFDLYSCVILGPPDWVEELVDEFGK